ncbi:hypothetical protein [Gymnodinialimonas ulvae]|uniref:hypothetical protein n=1 Tax=Gymnodinialimonas ulvae TaxID=3126504 RepID=UPI0030A20481
MNKFILVAGLLGLTGCVDPLPVGEGGPFGTVSGTAPREAVGPGPFATGGSTGGTGIGTAVSENDPRLAEGFRRFDFVPESAYVGGQEGVVIFVAEVDETTRGILNEDNVYGVITRPDENCGYYVDIYGRRYGNCT